MTAALPIVADDVRDAAARTLGSATRAHGGAYPSLVPRATKMLASAWLDAATPLESAPPIEGEVSSPGTPTPEPRSYDVQ